MLSVAIALEPPTDSAVVAQIVRSCERAIGDGRCRDALELAPSAVVTWYALIRLEDPSLPELKVEFYDRNASGTLIETRQLSFSERDTSSSRWASAGAVIAAFVAARDATVAATPAPKPLPLPPPPPLQPPPLPERGPAWNVDLALFAGPGLDRGAYRVGGLGRGYIALPQASRVLGLVSLRYAERPGDLALAWWSASCGMGARLGERSTLVNAELTGELVFERFQMSATDKLTTRSEDAAQNRFGGRLSLNLALNFAANLAFVTGVEATALRPSVAVTVGEERVGRAPAVSYAFSGGLRFSAGGN